MKKARYIISLVLAVALLVSLTTSMSFAASYKNISVTAPSSVTVTPGKSTAIKIQFKGEGIGYTKAYVTSGISGTQSTQWKGYPSICTTTLNIKATKAGTVTFVLGNNEDGDFKKVNIKIKLVASSTSQKYYVSHVKGVNLRSKASTSGKILTAIPYGTALTVTQVSGNWGKTTYNKKTGWVCLDYCSKNKPSTGSSGTSSTTNTGSSIPASIRVTQMYSNSCTSAAATILVRGYYYINNKDYLSVTESQIRSAGWNGGLSNSFNVNGCKVRALYISGSISQKEAKLRKLLQQHPEGLVIFGWNSSRSHAVYLSKDFKVLDPAKNASKNYISIERSFLPGSSLASVQKIWYIQ